MAPNSAVSHEIEGENAENLRQLQEHKGLDKFRISVLNVEKFSGRWFQSLAPSWLILFNPTVVVFTSITVRSSCLISRSLYKGAAEEVRKIEPYLDNYWFNHNFENVRL